MKIKLIGLKMSEVYPFNSYIEYALRCAILLEAEYPRSLSMQRIVFYDYLLTHSEDANGPKSIHLSVPNRISEISVKREKMNGALLLLQAYNLVETLYNENGIEYTASDEITPFLNEIDSKYVNQLKTIAIWVCNSFDAYSDQELIDYFRKNIGKWGGEFEKSSLLFEEGIINE